MTAYARSDVEAVRIPVEAGGCGVVHERPSADGFGLECEPCATWLLANHSDQWGSHPTEIPLTPTELIAAERDDADGQKLIAMAGRGLGEKIAAEMSQRAPVSPDTNTVLNQIMDRMDRLERDSKAELAAKDARIAELETALKAKDGR